MRMRATAGIAALASALLLTSCTSGADTAKDGTVTVLVAQNTNQIPVAKMQWAKDLAKDIGCSVDWQSVDDTAWGKQKNPSLAAGDVPDVAIRAISNSDAAQYPGLFEDIDTHLGKLPNVKRFFDEKPDAEKLAADAKGAIYALPSSRGKGYTGSGQHMMINKAWLDKVGLPVPTTWGELTTALEAFKTQDPNGNGKADEIPFNVRRLDTGGFGWFSPMLLLNSTGITTQFNKGPSAQGIYVSNGKVSNFLVTDEYREVVDYLHGLMKAGLIPADAFTKDDSAYYADQTGDGVTAKTGVIFGWSLADFGKSAGQYVAMPVPAATADMRPDQVVWDGSDNEYETGKLSVSAAAAKDPCVWKLVDALYGTKYSMEQFGGSLGTYVTDDGSDTYTLTDAYAAALADNQVPALADRLAGWIPDAVTVKGDANQTDLRKVDDVYAQQYENSDPVKDRMPDYVRLNADDQTTVSNNDTAVLNYAMQRTSEWIVKGGADAGWDDYVAQVKSLGVDQNVKIWQAAYDEYARK